MQLKYLPVAALVLSNLFPLFGVFFFDWDVKIILLLYWCENLVIGFYNVVKILSVSFAGDIKKNLFGNLFVALFFMVHYGGFTAAHGMFLLEFLELGDSGDIMGGESWPGPLVFLQLLYNVISQLWQVMPDGLGIPLLALFISHGVSFSLNFVFAGEYKTATTKKLMAQPYTRVIIMHVTVLAGGFAVMALDAKFILLVILILFKIWVDIWQHRKEHRHQQMQADMTEVKQ